MSKKHCSRCGKKELEKKYNPYNETFKNHHFEDRGFFCLKCGEWFVKLHNRFKGGHWVLEKAPDVSTKPALDKEAK